LYYREVFIIMCGKEDADVREKEDSSKNTASRLKIDSARATNVFEFVSCVRHFGSQIIFSFQQAPPQPQPSQKIT
jgi:hypothetical protein